MHAGEPRLLSPVGWSLIAARTPAKLHAAWLAPAMQERETVERLEAELARVKGERDMLQHSTAQQPAHPHLPAAAGGVSSDGSLPAATVPALAPLQTILSEGGSEAGSGEGALQEHGERQPFSFGSPFPAEAEDVWEVEDV